MATWYEKLAEYFPVEEMKSKQHMELLLKEKGTFTIRKRAITMS